MIPGSEWWDPRSSRAQYFTHVITLVSIESDTSAVWADSGWGTGPVVTGSIQATTKARVTSVPSIATVVEGASAAGP